MTPLHQKLNQLSLTAMSRQLDQTLTDAAAQNRSFTETLESLADLELESRNHRAIERRFRSSRLQAQYSIDNFHFKHHKSRMELKNRILRLLDLEFLSKGTSAIFIGNPGRRKNISGKNHCLARVSGQSARALYYCHGHAQSTVRLAGRSLRDSQAEALH